MDILYILQLIRYVKVAISLLFQRSENSIGHLYLYFAIKLFPLIFSVLINHPQVK